MTLRACLKLQESQEVALQHLLYIFINIICIYVCVRVLYYIVLYIYICHNIKSLSYLTSPSMAHLDAFYIVLPPNLGDKMPYILINLHRIIHS